ncbi:ABC transporter permease [Desertimonas flava]|uniref:ABC transporter permease n=1 Tax=Desertimonas flava TaxID=2064846 RepID=UPI000E356621|nr:ABC transporter permease [Desertimonas flava]
MSDHSDRAGRGATWRPDVRLALGNLLFSTRFATIWIAMAALLVICRIAAPSVLSSASWSSLLPLGSVVAIVALGQMLVIMMGGIDLSMGASISLLANVLVGVSKGSDDRLARAIVVVFVVAAVIGLVNGLLVAVLELNPLIVTLATSLILLGITSEYRAGTANNSSVPDNLSDFVFAKVLGVSKTFWFVVALTLVLGLLLRSSAVGRRFQAVGANRRAAWMAGFRVRLYIVGAYVAASIGAGLAAIFIGGIVVNPGVNPGASYLLGPVAAVVLGGAALSGGLASPASTWVAAFFVTLLNQMLKVLGLTNASQFVVFGAAIVVGMLISGDRIAELIGRLLLRPSLRRYIDGDDEAEPRARPATQLDHAVSRQT